MTRNYSSTASATTLSSGINDSATSIAVAATTGFPAASFILVIDPDTVSQELVLVTNVAGTTLTVTRGYDSTTAVAHSAGAAVRHAHAAIDFRESAVHQAASAGVHGAAGSVVGTSDAQTLTNKTLGNTNTLNGFTASRVMQSDGSGKLTASTKVVPTGALVGDTDTQTLTGKDLTTGNTFPASLATDAEVATAVSNHAALTATHGVAGALVGTTDSQTLTNKTLTAPTITSPVITGAGQVQRVVKSADETVTSSTTLQNDNHLVFSVAAGGTYIFEVFLLADCAANNVDMKIAFTFPAGSMVFGVLGLDPATGAGGVVGNIQTSGTASATSGSTAVSVGVAGGHAITANMVRGSFVASGAGTVTLQWAQDSSSANSVTVSAGSYIRAERVA